MPIRQISITMSWSHSASQLGLVVLRVAVVEDVDEDADEASDRIKPKSIPSPSRPDHPTQFNPKRCPLRRHPPRTGSQVEVPISRYIQQTDLWLRTNLLLSEPDAKDNQLLLNVI